MKYILTSLSLLALTISCTIGAECLCEPQDYSFYIKVDSGISFAEPARVYAPPLTWIPAIQGYDSKLGNQAIVGLSIGCEFMRSVDIEISASHRSAFKYRKFQTPIFTEEPTRTREFDLDVTPFLLSINLLGQNISCLNWDVACGKIYPMIGVGVGVSNLLITNFRTTGLPPTPASEPFASFATDNAYTLRKNFTYTALIGLEYNYQNCWAIATGYRWLDAGKFRGPRFLRIAAGDAVDLDGEEWRIRFRSNEWFIEFKIFL